MHLELIKRVKGWLRAFTRLIMTVIDINFSRTINFDISITSNDMSLKNIDRIKIYEIDVKTWQSLNSNLFNTDPISGFVIDSTQFSPILRPRKIKSIDIRFIWEISRFQFPSEMFDKKNNLDNYIRLFEHKNPLFFGPNWVSPMEAGIRAVNILIKRISTSNNSSTVNNFLNKSFYFLINNLENHNYHKGNHYMINLCSLLFLISKSNYSNEINIKYLIDELESEILLQYNKDGSYYENSTYYHLFVTEALCQTLYFIKNECSNSILKKIIENNSRLHKSDPILNVLGKALHFSQSINYKNQIFPSIGDEDSGRFIYTSTKINNLEQNFYRIVPNELKNINFFKTVSIQSKGDTTKTINHYSLPIEKLKIRHFKDFGLIILKSDNFFLTLRTNYCEKKMVHAHEDLGSINLIINDKIILWDPGTYTYNRNIDDRNYFRSGKNHNVQRVTSTIEKLKSPFIFKSTAKTMYSIKETKNSVSIDFKLQTEKETIKRKILIQSNGIHIFCDPETNLKLPIKFSPKYGKIENFTYSRSIFSL